MKRFTETAKSIKVGKAINQLKALKDGTVVPIPLSVLSRDENIRSALISKKDKDIGTLAESIKEVGLLQFPVITVSNNKVVCVAGHRRLQACEMIGFEKVSCVIKKFDALNDKEMSQVLENTARKSLHPLDLGKQLLKMKDRGYSQIRLQEILGKDRKTIGRFQKIATWSKEAHKIIEGNPEELKTGILLKLASRDLSNKELVRALKVKTGAVKAEKSDLVPKSQLNLAIKTKDYLKDKGLSRKEQNSFLRMLVDLGYLKKEALAK
ncbi:ParB/RepB/Spo0J family partition protein [bacterium]|nr:ParB/RepB/Spo0J family partition protein [bacterium]